MAVPQFTGSLMVPFNGNLQTVVLSLLTGLIPSTGGHVGPRFMRVTSVSESVAGATANVTILMDGIRGVLYSQQVRRRCFSRRISRTSAFK